EYIESHGQFGYQSTIEVYSQHKNLEAGHQYFNLFDDPVLIAYSLDEFNEVMYRIVEFEDGRYFVYKRHEAYVKGDKIGARTYELFQYNAPIIQILKEVSNSQIEKEDNKYTFYIKYDDLILEHP